MRVRVCVREGILSTTLVIYMSMDGCLTYSCHRRVHRRLLLEAITASRLAARQERCTKHEVNASTASLLTDHWVSWQQTFLLNTAGEKGVSVAYSCHLPAAWYSSEQI